MIDIDATLITAHSAKAGAAVTFKKTYGHHPLAAWCANTVRHEARQDRAEVKGLRLPVVAAAG